MLLIANYCGARLLVRRLLIPVIRIWEMKIANCPAVDEGNCHGNCQQMKYVSYKKTWNRNSYRLRGPFFFFEVTKALYQIASVFDVCYNEFW